MSRKIITGKPGRYRVIVDLSTYSGITAAKAQLKTIYNTYKNPEGFLVKFEKTLKAKYIRPMLRELKAYPNRRKWPADYPSGELEWTSEAQRRFVMMKLRKEDNFPFERNNALKRGWNTKTKISAGKLSIRINNRRPESKYVVGLVGLGKSASSVRRYMRPMQRFHGITGWQPAYKTVQKYMGRAKEDAVATLKQWLADGANT